MSLPEEAFIQHAITARTHGFAEFCDTRGLLSVVREDTDILAALQSREMPTDADGVLVFNPAPPSLELPDAFSGATVTRDGERWWVVPTPGQAAIVWDSAAEHGLDVAGLLPTPALELAIARRYAKGWTWVDTHHGVESPIALIVAGAANDYAAYARRRVEAVAAADDLMLANFVRGWCERVGGSFQQPMAKLVAAAWHVDDDLDVEAAWAALEDANEVLELMPWEMCDPVALAKALGIPNVIDPVWWGPRAVGHIALLSLDHLADSLEVIYAMDEELGNLAFTRLGALFASHRRPHGVPSPD